MNEKPILFSAPMVRAILAGQKTQTRRTHGIWGTVNIGTRLWVRESWQAWSEYDKTKPINLPDEARDRINYLANGNKWDARIRPGIHMPRWASRLTLVVTDVRVQRLQDISEEDAKAEGCNKAFEVKDLKDAFMKIMGKAAGEDTGSTYRIGFATLWEEINGPGSWDKNPYVYAVTFSVASAQRQDEERSDTTSNLANTGA